MARKRTSNSKSKEGFKDDNKQRNNVGRTKGNSIRSKSSNRNRKEREEIENSTNDPTWYSANAELLRDAASIPFSWPTGTTLEGSGQIYEDTVPGVMSLTLKPTIGSSMNMNAPVNVASNAIYSYVRHANSGHSNYDAPDLMIYLIAMSHIYSFVTWCQRLLGIVSMYDQRNRYMPYALVSANFVSFEDLKNNIANFRYWLNNYITKVASLAVPNVMNVFSRLAFLYSNVYIDGPTVKDQLYMYVPEIEGKPWMKFSLDANQAGQLDWESFTISGGGSYAAVSDIIAYGNSLFNAIWDQEDFGIMSGDILKAYGDNIVKLSPVPIDFQLSPIYDTMFLHQFKNARLGGAFDISKISQSNGIITQLVFMDTTLSAATQKVARQYGLWNKVLSSDFDSPTPEVVIESTRLMFGYDRVTNYVHCGTELPTKLRVWGFSNSGVLGFRTTGWNFAVLYNYSASATLTMPNVMGLLENAAYYKQFKYAPEMFAICADSNNDIIVPTFRVWDIDNYAVLSNDDIIKMHEAALMSLFAVPAIAKIS